MELFVLISLIASPLLGSATDNKNQCGCVDQSWCKKEDPNQKLDCPLSHSLCSNTKLSNESRLDIGVASVSTECENGWSVESLKHGKYGFPNRFVAVIQNNLTDGSEHTMYIEGYNGKMPARFIFKSNDSEGNVPLFMTMFLWEGYISMNEKKDGHWCQNDIRVENIVGSREWHMRFKVQMWDGKQQFDILYHKNNDYYPTYRFYPQTHIKRGDWFIFYEGYHYIMGISWSRKKDVQFKRSPTPGSRIVIHVEFGTRRSFDIYIKNENGHNKIHITGGLGGWSSWQDFFYPGRNIISGYGKEVDCLNYSFTTGKTAVIVFEVMEHGIKYYGDGYFLTVFETNDLKPSDISQIDVGDTAKVLGYGANTCDYYRY